MSFETPHRGQSSTPATGVRPSFESTHPHIPAPTPLSPVAQSVDHKSSGRSPSLAQPDHEDSDQPNDQLDSRPSLNRNRSSWRSGRTQSWGVDDRDDRDDRNNRKSYRAISSQDFAPTPAKFAHSRDYSDPYHDHRFSYYDHPYYNHPHHGPPPPQNGPPQNGPPRNGPPRASWRSSAATAVPPLRASRVSAKAASAASANSRAPSRVEEPSESESEDEQQAPQQAKNHQQQRPLTWGYDDMSQVTALPQQQPQEVIMRLPFSDWMNSGLRAHIVSAIAEFTGTVMFLFFAFAGTQVANINADNPTEAAASTTGGSTGFSPIVLTYIALSFGFSLMVNVWIFYRISGGLFNPAVTLGMVMVKSLTYTRGFLLVCAQISGSIVTSLIVKALFPVDFNVRTTLSPGTSLVQGVFIEGLLTAELVFAIFMLAKEKHRATYLAPIGIGIAMFVAELVGVYYTGGSLNPARSLGPCVVTGIWDKEHWIYWVGPGCGAIAAVGFYNFIKMLEYEMANPGQDSTSEGKAAREATAVKEKKEEETTALA